VAERRRRSADCRNHFAFPGCGAARQRCTLIGVFASAGALCSEFATIPGPQRNHFVLRCARGNGCGRWRMTEHFFAYILTNRPKGVLYVGVTEPI